MMLCWIRSRLDWNLIHGTSCLIQCSLGVLWKSGYRVDWRSIHRTNQGTLGWHWIQETVVGWTDFQWIQWIHRRFGCWIGSHWICWTRILSEPDFGHLHLIQLKKSPCWINKSYLKSISADIILNDYLLYWTVSLTILTCMPGHHLSKCGSLNPFSLNDDQFLTSMLNLPLLTSLEGNMELPFVHQFHLALNVWDRLFSFSYFDFTLSTLLSINVPQVERTLYRK